MRTPGEVFILSKANSYQGDRSEEGVRPVVVVAVLVA